MQRLGHPEDQDSCATAPLEQERPGNGSEMRETGERTAVATRESYRAERGFIAVIWCQGSAGVRQSL
jgi:hypothetical protein